MVLSLALFPFVPVHATTYEIIVTSSGDSWVNSGSSGTNYGSDTGLWAQGSLMGEDQRAYYMFDLYNLPAGTVINATLYLYQIQANDANTIKIYRVITDWDEDTITWDAQPTISTSETYAQTQAAGWKTFNVTLLSTSIAGFYGYSVRQNSETALPDDENQFASEELAGYEPYLVIFLTAGAVGTTTLTTWGDGAAITGGSIFDIMATNSSHADGGSGAQVDTYMYNLQHMHVATTLFMDADWNATSNDWDCPTFHTETGYLKYGISYLASDGEQIISGWYCKIEVTDGDVTNDTTSENWVELSVEWYNDQTLIKTDTIYCAFEAYISTDITTQISLYVDLWLSSDSDHTRVGGAVSSKYFGMYEDGWWLWSSWTPKNGLNTLSTFYDDLYDEDSVLAYTWNFTTFIAWTELGKVAEGESDFSDSCDTHYWATQVTSLEFICAPYGQTLYGINTPILMPTTTPDSPLGFFATLGNSIVDALNDMSYALQTAFSGLSSYSSAAVDAVFDSFGVSDFSTNIATFIGDAGAQFGSAITYATSLITSIFTIFANVGLFIITWFGKVITSLTTLFDTMINIMNGTNPVAVAGEDLFSFLNDLWAVEDLWGFMPTVIVIAWMMSLDSRAKQFGIGWLSLLVADVQNLMSILSFIMDVAWRIINVVIDLVSRFIFWWI